MLRLHVKKEFGCTKEFGSPGPGSFDRKRERVYPYRWGTL